MDKLQQNVDQRHALNPYSDIRRTILIGKVIEYVQYINLYGVRIEHGPMVVATPLLHGTSHAGRATASYSIGSDVLIYFNDTSNQHIILGSVANPLSYAGFNVSHWINPNNDVGIVSEEPHSSLLNLRWKKRNYNNNSSYDAYEGDYLIENPLGLMFHLGLGTIGLKASETVGLWGFYLNRLLRLSGYNFDFRSSYKELISRDDEGENIEVVKSSQYPWEMRGALTPETDPLKKSELNKSSDYDSKTGEDPVLLNKQVEGKYVPKYPDQTPISRRTVYGGYLGDIERDQVICPPSKLGADNIERLSNTEDYVGLSEIVRHQDGLVEVRSTKGIVLQKDAYIPTIRQTKTAEDPTGDTALGNEYKFASMFGSGKDHDKTEYRTESAAYNLLSMHERLAWIHNKLGLATLYNRKDWKVSKSTETNKIDSGVYTLSRYTHRAAMPAVYDIKLDHRPGNSHKYTKSRSTITMEDDGSITIEDAWGSAIVMNQGNIQITCAGDIIMNPGRNVFTLAGNDVHVRAGQNIDIAAAHKDVRIKAERNLSCLAAAGDSGGGVLIESRNTSTPVFDGVVGDAVVNSGIVLKCTEASNIMLIAKSGAITTFADYINNKANNTINNIARTELNWLSNSSAILFNATPENPNPTCIEFHSNSVASFGQTSFFGISAASAFFGGSGIFAGSLSANSVAQPGGGQLGSVLNFTKIINDYKNITSTVNETSQQFAQSISLLFSDPSIALINKSEIIGFSFRTDEQYKIDFEGVFLTDARWQQMNRGTASTSTWKENPVKSPSGVDTLPYPGYDAWTTKELLYSLKPTLWTVDSGEAYGLENYTNNKPDYVKHTLNNNYIINAPNN